MEDFAMWNLRSQVKPTARQQILALLAALLLALFILALDAQAQPAPPIASSLTPSVASSLPSP